MPQDPRPNILLIMTDQQRGDCLGIDGHPVLMTPNLDNLAARGARFTRAYSTCPICIPARRCLMSGQYPARAGILSYREGVEWEQPPPLMPQVLRDAGYQTALVGRNMHMSPRRKRYGFEQTLMTAWQDPNEYLDDFNRQVADPTDGVYATGVMHNDWTACPWPHDVTLHPTHWTVSKALHWLGRRDPTAPFFLTVSFLAPHPPLIPPAFYLERYLQQDLPAPVYGDWAEPPPHDGMGDDVSSGRVHLRGEALRYAQAAYFGLIHHIDDQLRRLLNGLTGVDKLTGQNTVVLFTSDHGEMLGDHYLFRKSVPYEGSTRIPLMIRAPRRFEIEPRTVIDAPTCLEDIMPTVLDFAGVEKPDTMDGRSLLPLMRGASVAWRDYLPIEMCPSYQCLTDGREKYIWFTRDGSERFFDLTCDPHELHDLTRDPAAAERVGPWRQRMIAHLQSRPEGFSDGTRLIAGRDWHGEMAHARISPDHRPG